LNLQNILVTVEKNIVLYDFIDLSLDNKWLVEYRGEIRFICLFNGKTTIQDDIFVLGCIFYKIFTRRLFYIDKEDYEVGSLYKKGIFLLVNQLSIGDIIIKCWVNRYNYILKVFVDLV